ncbi:DUF3800 domain-containing protein [candidate division KSB1 bacterium]|nr:DUF3800 domain-containing protein [candidate division KSB1 bacterium]
MAEFSDAIVFVDESGDHGLERIDPDYPLFVLSFCIFNKVDYYSSFVPAVKKLKFDYFGHDQVILREHSIRKRQDAFERMNKEQRESFLNELSHVIEATSFVLIAIVVKKSVFHQRYSQPSHVYHLAMEYGLERLYRLIRNKCQDQKLTHVIFEARGKSEDQRLELEFRRKCGGDNYFKKILPFEIMIVDKKANSEGLQIADMTARPVGLFVLRPGQPNRAFDILKGKFYRDKLGNISGFGIKVFP